MKPLDHSTLVSCLHQTSHDPYLSVEFRTALAQALTLVEHSERVLEHLAATDFDFATGQELANAAGLSEQFAITTLEYYMPEDTVEELYNRDDDFASALIALVGADKFEYPDWSHKTVGEVLELFK